MEDWYPPEFVTEINRYYEVQSVVREPAGSSHLESGRFLPLIGECRIMTPRTVALGPEAESR